MPKRHDRFRSRVSAQAQQLRGKPGQRGYDLKPAATKWQNGMGRMWQLSLITGLGRQLPANAPQRERTTWLAKPWLAAIVLRRLRPATPGKTDTSVSCGDRPLNRRQRKTPDIGNSPSVLPALGNLPEVRQSKAWQCALLKQQPLFHRQGKVLSTMAIATRPQIFHHGSFQSLASRRIASNPNEHHEA